MSRRRRRRSAPSSPAYRTIVPMLVLGLMAFLSLGAALRVYALPVEARTTAPWYAYKSSVGFDFTAYVQTGKFYASSTMRPGQLARIKMPVDPPLYRRVLISRLVDTVEVRIPYSFQADRTATTQATFRIDGMLNLTGFWQKSYPLMQGKQLTLVDNKVSGVETVRIPVAQFLSDIEQNRNDLGFSVEPLELVIQPILEVETSGLREPVHVINSPEFRVNVRANTVDLDDPREERADKILTETKVVPITMTILGSEIDVATLRQISMSALGLSLLLAVLFMLVRRRRQSAEAILERLGPNLITTDSFDLPPSTAVADLQAIKELIQMQVQTERPVIKVGSICYLFDGTVCYRYRLEDEELLPHGQVPKT